MQGCNLCIYIFHGYIARGYTQKIKTVLLTGTAKCFPKYTSNEQRHKTFVIAKTSFIQILVQMRWNAKSLSLRE